LLLSGIVACCLMCRCDVVLHNEGAIQEIRRCSFFLRAGIDSDVEWQQQRSFY
jgi:hypothetical protein